VNEADFVTNGFSYADGAKALVYSLKHVYNTERDVIVLVTPEISQNTRDFMVTLGAKIKEVQKIPKPTHMPANPWNITRWNDLFTKIRLWELTDYNKIVFLDSDCLILHSIDFFFSYPELSATQRWSRNVILWDGWNGHLFVLTPSKATFDNMVKLMNTEFYPTVYVEQSFLNWYFGSNGYTPMYAADLDPVIYYKYNNNFRKLTEERKKLPILHDKFWTKEDRIAPVFNQIWLDHYNGAVNFVKKQKENYLKKKKRKNS